VISFIHFDAGFHPPKEVFRTKVSAMKEGCELAFEKSQVVRLIGQGKQLEFLQVENRSLDWENGSNNNIMAYCYGTIRILVSDSPRRNRNQWREFNPKTKANE